MQKLIDYNERFKKLDSETIQELKNSVEMETSNKNQFILEQVERCHKIWFLKKGTVRKFHLSFFNHQHLHSDGNYRLFAQTYMQILNFLKSDGTSHYAPGLPFIEKYLDNAKND